MGAEAASDRLGDVPADAPSDALRARGASESPAVLPRDHDRLLDAEEVAALLHVPVRWVRDHSRTGLLPRVKLGKYVRYRREAVLAWISEQEHGGATWRKHHPRTGAGRGRAR